MAAGADVVGDVTADGGGVHLVSDGAELQLGAVIAHHHLVPDEPLEDQLRATAGDVTATGQDNNECSECRLNLSNA